MASIFSKTKKILQIQVQYTYTTMTFIRVPIFSKRFVAHSGIINKRESNEDINTEKKYIVKMTCLPSLSNYSIDFWNHGLKQRIGTGYFDIWLYFESAIKKVLLIYRECISIAACMRIIIIFVKIEFYTSNIV